MHGGWNGGKKDLTAKLIWCVSTNTNSPLKQETLLKHKTSQNTVGENFVALVAWINFCTKNFRRKKK